MLVNANLTKGLFGGVAYCDIVCIRTVHFPHHDSL